MKTCLVGCGGIAAVHGSVLTSGIDTEFVAAADIKPEKAQSYAENFHTKPYPSLESMLDAEKPDVLHICTPHYLHVPMTIYALERNINVFMEKPPAISFDQLEELKKAAAKSDAQLGFCYQNRQHPRGKGSDRLRKSRKSPRRTRVRNLVQRRSLLYRKRLERQLKNRGRRRFDQPVRPHTGSALLFARRPDCGRCDDDQPPFKRRNRSRGYARSLY